MTHLLVTNDYPPKIGGIQNYLWELWRRLPADQFAVLTRPHPGDAAFDDGEPYRVVRSRQRFLLPTAPLRRTIDGLADEIDAGLVVFDPAVPVGALGPSLRHRYAVILHGAEVAVPARLPGTRQVLARTVANASLIISASGYASAEAERAAGPLPPSVYVPPGVDVDRFVPLSDDDRMAVRRRLGLAEDSILVLGVSRLVPRKGFDVLIEAADRVGAAEPRLEVVIAGTGRDRRRLERLAAQARVPVRFLGRVDDADLADLYACVDIFAMLCRSRWGGLEQEGFGIVFVEAAASGTPQLAGDSGGAAEAVEHRSSGLIVKAPESVDAVAAALSELAGNESRRKAMGRAGRERVVRELSYDLLSRRLHDALRQFGVHHDGLQSSNP
ncbi:MAG: glycosyltransferase family 4 protein [Acidimicrobiia bacterium]|nr:glycosyltransferase family 4 protein [Acidimicrobiia bacterium]